MFSTQLAQRAAENNPIRVGIIGAGKFGAGLVAQLSQMRGMVASAIADINLEHAIGAYTVSNIPSDAISQVQNVNTLNDTIRNGKRAVLDGSGGYTVNGLIEKADVARAENLLPLGLSDNTTLKCDVSQGEAISYDMVELDEDTFVLKLRRLQDATV